MHTNDNDTNEIKLVNVLVNVPTQTGQTNAVGLVRWKS